MQTLLIIILVFLSLRLLFRFLAPYIAQWFMKKVQNRMQKTFTGYSGRPHAEAHTTKRSTKRDIPQEKKVVGEYIDFEEID